MNISLPIYMFAQSLIVSLLALKTTAQSNQTSGAFSCSNSKGPTFNQCMANAVVDTTGQPIPAGSRTPATACNAVQNDPAENLACLCERFTGVVGCYTAYCPQDPGLGGYQTQQKAVCDESAKNPKPKSTKTASVIYPTSTGANSKPTFEPSSNGVSKLPVVESLFISTAAVLFGFF
ncbi:hypothetical protein HDV02_001630 [Globomyces sp. JEL0801]|nr:hypothetical protein HDV02_001630 [Globomyces sp. JEL0801]